MNVESSIPECFSEQASRRPNERAISGTRWQPSFAELDAASSELATSITKRSGGPAGRVAVLLGHDAPLVAAMLAALKSGGTPVVLDSRWPAARLERIGAELGAHVALTDTARRELALAAGFPGSGLVMVPERPEPASSAPPAIAPAPDDLAFLIQTSGSTGTPKAVMQTHRNVLHNALVRLAGGLEIGPEDRVVLLASPSGGQGLSTVWTTLLTGGTLCPFPVAERGVTGLPEFLAEQGVTVLVASASLFRHFVRTLDGRRLPGIRLVRVGSEQVFASDFEAFQRHFDERCRFVNSFSSSETGNVTQHVLRADDRPRPGPLPAGRPAAGMELLLLEDGEIAVRSDYLSPGYWGDQPLTDKRFRDGVFRTGDLGRISEDGAFTVLGRKDAQVKVRGSRVDLLEVEGALVARPEVAATAVSPSPSQRGETALTAYVALQPGAARDARELREGLRATLPTHAVPTSFTFVDAIPLNAHGKVDREALVKIGPQADRSADSASAITETEELLATIWADALEREAVTPEDDFFELAGDSLTAAEIAAAVHESFGVEIELGAFAENPTVAAMAELIERQSVGDHREAERRLPKVSRDEPIPCSLAQERTWRESQTAEGSIAYNIARGVRFTGSLDVEALRRCIERLIARHEALRTTFAERDGIPVQIVQAPPSVELPVVEIEGPLAGEELLLRESLVPYDLERGPLVRFLLLRLSESEHWLLRLNHHINSDGRSWEIFFEELATLYEADLRRQPPALTDEARTQYADFAAWERRTVGPGTERWRSDIEWWRANLEGAPLRSPLPFARREPDERAVPSDGILSVPLPPRLATALDSLRRGEGATHFMLRLAAFSALLAFMTGQADTVVGVYSTTRRLVETRDMFGFFANPVAVRLRFPGNSSFRDWLREVRNAVIQVSAHAQTPYDAVCEELRATGTSPPELQGILGFRDVPPTMRFGGLEMTHIDRVFPAMPWRFTLQSRRSGAGERCFAAFDARLHDPRAVRLFLRRYQGLLAKACTDPDRPIGDLIPRRRRRFGPFLRRQLVAPIESP
ncbi:MAG TPA: condensation domain-containing protein [Solirubrobacterales bacterium]|nr:condensation domain-containing protein [Solirubrobacterales bacterium]